MSGAAAAVGPRQRYAAAIQQLRDVSNAPDLPAAIAVFKKVRRLGAGVDWWEQQHGSSSAHSLMPSAHHRLLLCLLQDQASTAAGLLLSSCVGSTEATDQLGLTDFSKFQSLGPALLQAHCAACAHVLSLIQDAITTTNGSPNSPLIREGWMVASVALTTFQVFLRAWYDVLPGIAHRASSGVWHRLLLAMA